MTLLSSSTLFPFPHSPLTAGYVILAWWLPFAPLGSSVLEPDLHARLIQIEFERQLLARENVGVGGALERSLQLVQLVCREGGPDNTETGDVKGCGCGHFIYFQSLF